jgi:hypothetical protein
VDESDGNSGQLLTLPRAPSRSRQPSPGLYSSPGSPSLATSSGTLSGPDGNRTSRRPRPPGLRNSYDRWGESYEQWERSQLEQETSPSADTDSSMQQQQRRGLRSVVNEGLKAAGLTGGGSSPNMRPKPEEGQTRPRKLSNGLLGREVFANSPISSLRERNWESMDLTKTGSTRLSSERPRSRISPEDQDSRSDMDSLRERATRHAFFSPNARPTRTIHNVLSNQPGDSPAANEVDAANGRETPANLRIFKSNYSSTFASTPMMKSYTSPSGTQRTLPPRAATVANLSTGSPKVGVNGSPLSAIQPSSGNLSTSGGPVQLLQEALFMFESHVQRLPQNSAMPDTFNDVLRDAKGIVQSASALNIALRSAATICVDEQIEAEIEAQADQTKENANSVSEVAEVWRKVGAEFREDVRVSDELVRALTSFMIGTGRMLRSASSTASHGRMKSVGDAASTVGSVSRAGGTSISRGTSLVRGMGGGSSDGRRSVEGWSRGVGLSAIDRRSVDGRMSTDGRRSVEPVPYGGNRISADEHREESMRRLTARQGPRDPADVGSNGSDGSRDRPTTRTANRSSYQAAGSGNQSRATSALGVPRLSNDETTPRTFTSLSSKRSSGMHTPASAAQKALPKLPLPAPEVAFPQTQDGGDRTPIDLPRPHTRHSTMPPLAVPPPLPTLPSESLLQRSRTIGKHAASNSITSASTSSTTKPQLASSHATVRGSVILPAPSSAEATTAVTPTTARPRQTSFTSAASNPLSLGRARGSAAVSGLQQVALSNPPRKRTISTTDDEGIPATEANPNALAITQSNSSLSSNTMSKASSGALSSPGGRKSSFSSGSSPLVESRKSTLRPAANRRTSSMLSGGSSSTVTSPTQSASHSDTARHRVVSRVGSTGALGNAAINNTSRSSLVSGVGANSTDSTGDDERKLRRSRVRMSLNAMMDKRGGIGELLGGRKLGSVSRLAGHDAEHEDIPGPGDSPSLSAKERLSRRRAAEPLLP